MIYTTKERNNAILLLAAGKADLTNTLLYERLEEFNWVIITRLKGVINNIQLTYSGLDLNRQLLKQQQNENVKNKI